MIQYDRNMRAEDLVAYWQGGYVIARQEEDNKWALAMVRLATLDDVTLDIGSKRVVVTRDQFFRDVILHRPSINLVEQNGVVYRLTWAPPQRDASRYITGTILQVSRLNPERQLLDEAVQALQQWQDQYLQLEVRERVGTNLAPPFADNEYEQLSLKLLIHSLNYEYPASVREQVIKALESPKDVALLLNSDEYVHKHGDMCTIYVGRTPLCDVRYDEDDVNLNVILSLHVTPSSCWWRRGQELIRELTQGSNPNE